MAQHLFSLTTATSVVNGSFTTDGSRSTFESQLVIGATGTINGNPITGVSDYLGADNRLLYASQTRGAYYYTASPAGISFEAGGVSYNISRANDIDTLRSSAGGGTSERAGFGDQTFEAVCFTTGTLIRTARGEVAVEDLIVGDLAVTASGTLRPITWIGNRALDAKGEALPHNEQPIRIRAGAFGPGLPARDLRLSHGHPVLVGADANGEGGVLVPVMCLINGTSVFREPATQVTYWHIELDAHDILLAEGLAAESYYDMGSRVWFAGEDGMLTDPDFVPAGEHGRCRPVAVDGAPVEAERQRLDAMFAALLSDQCDWNAGLQKDTYVPKQA